MKTQPPHLSKPSTSSAASSGAPGNTQESSRSLPISNAKLHARDFILSDAHDRPPPSFAPTNQAAVPNPALSSSNLLAPNTASKGGPSSWRQPVFNLSDKTARTLAPSSDAATTHAHSSRPTTGARDGSIYILWDPNRAYRTDYSAEEYGNKTANLSALQAFCKETSFSDDIKLAVPPFQGISHQQIRDHLIGSTGTKLARLEQELTMLLENNFKILTPSALNILHSIKVLVETSLKQNPLALDLLGFPRHVRLAVRSTGREDSDTVTNAGGNSSVPNVEHNANEIAAAIAEVVGSYYSQKSFAQRLIEGDDVVSPSFTPVLIQSMVGEHPNAPVPSSGVMFTIEPEGPTPVIQIEATFGHNEGVVRSRVPCDTYIVTPYHTVSSVAHKTYRLAPDRIRRLDANAEATWQPFLTTPNAADLRMRPALPDGVVTLLAKLGRELSARQGGMELDIEFTYLPGNATLYLLQKRRLILKDREQPTHLDPRAINRAKKLRGQMISRAGGTVRLLTSFDSILTAPTLEQALQIYLTKPRATTVQLVAVKNDAQSNSHEATMFRALNKPVMVLKNLEPIAAFLDENAPVCLNPSTHELVGLSEVAAAKNASNIDDLTNAGLVREGWGKHPLSAAHTQTTLALKSEAILKLLQDLLEDITNTSLTCSPHAGLRLSVLLDRLQIYTHRALAPDISRKNAIVKILEDLRTSSDAASRSRSLAVLIDLTYKISFFLKGDELLRRRSAQLFHSVCRQAIALRHVARDNPHGMLYLYELNVLSGLMLHYEDLRVVGNDSIETLLSERKERFAFAGDASINYRQAYARVGKMALRPELNEQWNTFAATIAQGSSASNKCILSQMVYDIFTLGVADLWLNVAFAQQAAAEHSPDSLLSELRLNFVSTENKNAFTYASSLRENCAAWTQRMSEWSDARNFDALSDDFKTSLLDRISKGVDVFQNSSQIGKLAVLHAFLESVNVVDLTIKEVLGNTSHASIKDKRRNTFNLIKEYFWLSLAWINTVPDLGRKNSGYKTESYWLRKICNRLIKHKTCETLVDEFILSSNFNVEAAQIGSGTNKSAHFPVTLEDYFTLAHQNLLAIASSMTVSTLGETHIFPQELKAVVDAFTRVSEKSDKVARSKIQLIGLNYQYPKLRIVLNAMLREHSMKLEILQDQTARGIFQVNISMFGAREHYRRERSIFYATLFASTLKVPFELAVTSTLDEEVQTTAWTWRIPSSGSIYTRFINNIANLTEHIIDTTYSAENIADVIANIGALVDNVDAAVENLTPQDLNPFAVYSYELLVKYPYVPIFYAFVMQSEVWGAKDLSVFSPSEKRTQNIKDVAAELFLKTMERSDVKLAENFAALPLAERQHLVHLVSTCDTPNMRTKSQLFSFFDLPPVAAESIVKMPDTLQQCIANLRNMTFDTSSGRVTTNILDNYRRGEIIYIHGAIQSPSAWIRFEIRKPVDDSNVVEFRFNDKAVLGVRNNSASLANVILAKIFGMGHNIRTGSAINYQFDELLQESKWTWFAHEGQQMENLMTQLQVFIKTILGRNYLSKRSDWLVQGLQDAIPRFSEIAAESPALIMQLPQLHKGLQKIIPDCLMLYSFYYNNKHKKVGARSSNLKQFKPADGALELFASQLLERLQLPNSKILQDVGQCQFFERSNIVNFICKFIPSARRSQLEQLLLCQDQDRDIFLA